MLTLELLDAGKGDATVFAYVDRQGTKHLGVLDGGTEGTYSRAIKPALLGHGLGRDATTSLRWVAVTHIDGDHIGGIIKLLADDLSAEAVYFNTPDRFPGSDIIDAGMSPKAAELVAFEARLARLLRSSADTYVPASVRQGNKLVGLVQRTQHNRPYRRRLVCGDTVRLDGLSMLVLAPSLERMRALLDVWQSVPQTSNEGAVVDASAKAKDDSVTNLSSFVFWLTYGDRVRMLFTGDALEEDILSGLKEQHLLADDGVIDVDVLKVPHHGSNSPADPGLVQAKQGLLERVVARHYIISADGQNENPSTDVLRRLVEANRDRTCTVWLPSPPTDGPSESHAYYRAQIAELEQLAAAEAPNMRVASGAAGQTSMTLELVPAGTDRCEHHHSGDTDD